MQKDKLNHFISTNQGSKLSIYCASGPVTIPMTNDYLFRALLQLNNKVLKYLISALLRIPISDILSVEILNPIILGQAYDEKDFYLDIRVCLNNQTIINLEMQVINERNWPERSLSYLCRSFDNLYKGAKYHEVAPAIQIGLLDFTLFPKHPEFYATYKMLNIKNHHVYSDKFQLSVLDLTRIDLATEEDKQFGLQHWASLFKATTWEEIIMLAEQNEYIYSAAETIYKLTQEEQIRLQCEAREDYYCRQRYAQLEKEHTEKELAAAREETTALKEETAVLKQEATALKEEATVLKEETAALKQEATALKEEVVAAKTEASTVKNQLASAEAENAELRARIAQLEAASRQS